ncbi:hypothetical protein IFM89_026119 [Coptis chinensis]|uniref:Uncharacterized protein n=1 Tax=Coptis chinensis TaxID=261450 RepID=A0A835IEK2_9MAGN|nr:hypothetical protein IFM89_026119 [Coptis chinensis]
MQAATLGAIEAAHYLKFEKRIYLCIDELWMQTRDFGRWEIYDYLVSEGELTKDGQRLGSDMRFVVCKENRT